MKARTCFSLSNAAFPIRLDQVGIDHFVVIYGKQIKGNLSYGDAARELGAAIMHACACDGKLDNRERGES